MTRYPFEEGKDALQPCPLCWWCHGLTSVGLKRVPTFPCIHFSYFSHWYHLYIATAVTKSYFLDNPSFCDYTKKKYASGWRTGHF